MGNRGYEEVERVHGGNADSSAHRLRRNRTGIRSDVVCRSGWDDAIQAEVIAEHTDRILHSVTAAEQVTERERESVRVTKRGRIFRALCIIQRYAAEGGFRAVRLFAGAPGSSMAVPVKARASPASGWASTISPKRS